MRPHAHGDLAKQLKRRTPDHDVLVQLQNPYWELDERFRSLGLGVAAKLVRPIKTLLLGRLDDPIPTG